MGIGLSFGVTPNCCLFVFLRALLVGNGAGGLAGGLAACLALAASGVCISLDAGLLNGGDMLHCGILQMILL